jgi:predicted phage-related endonuclease
MKPIDVWADKKGFREPIPETPQLRAGKRFERAILEEYSAINQIPLDFADHYQLIKVPGFPLLGATLDARWTIGDRRPVDAKNLRFKDDAWGDDGSSEFPDYYRMQLHVQAMACTTPAAELAPCFSGQDFYRYILPHDPEVDDLLKEEAERWWKKHIIDGVQPEPDGSESFTTYLKTRFKRNKLDLIEATDEAREIIDGLKLAKDELAQAEQKKALAEQNLKLLVGDHEGIAGLCTWKSNKDSEKTDYEAVTIKLRDRLESAIGMKDAFDLFQESKLDNTKTAPGARVLRLK